jgi:hypothetical protein
MCPNPSALSDRPDATRGINNLFKMQSTFKQIVYIRGAARYTNRMRRGGEYRMGEQKGRKTREHDLMLRRQAVQIGGQLPENPDDARKVIAYMIELIDGFMDSPVGKTPKLTVVGKDGVG